MVKGLKLSVVVENTASMTNPCVWAQHGLCLLLQIELSGSECVNILMDTGASLDVTLHNIDALNLDLSRVDVIFLSHGHYDHTGGLIGVLRRIGKPVPVVAHPSIFDPKLKGKPYLKFIGPTFTAAQIEAAGAVMIYAKNPVTLAKDVLTSGEVERTTPFEEVDGFQTVEDGRFIEDRLRDDQALIIHIEGKGLAVISGCAHSGIANTVKYAQKVTGIKDVYAVIGGFHLEKASEERIRSTLEELQKLNPRIIGPGHCTGIKAINHFIETFGDRCKPLAAGDTFEL
jgi:7,8-dihydropterin-6-yl-methyl-4-(beta-D-ribofuranosyl)aminobenzene 5'-phosphate synthase